MDFELFKELLDKLKKKDSIVLTGWGEPFTHPNIYSIIKYAKKKGHKVALTSNGMLMDAEKVVDSGIDSISFSVDSVKGNELSHPVGALKNIEKLVKEKKKRQLKKPEIVFQSVIINSNDVVDVAKSAKKLYIDRLNLTMLDERMGNVKNLKKKDLDDLIRRLKRTGIRFDLAQYAVGSGLKRIVSRFALPLLMRRKCLRLYDYLYINVKGEVTPCCNLPGFKIADALKLNNIKDAKNTKKYKKFLQQEKNICEGCKIFEPPEV